jgi:hypothetical protein
MAYILTPAEKVFLARMAEHMAKGLSMEDAARAVLDDDQRIAKFVLTSKDGPATIKALSAQVYHDLRQRDAIDRALNADEETTDTEPSLLPVFLRKEPTTDPAFLAYATATGFVPDPAVHYDVVAYWDETCTNERARWPWYRDKPTRRNNRLTLNCCNWRVVWKTDTLPKAGG